MKRFLVNSTLALVIVALILTGASFISNKSQADNRNEIQLKRPAFVNSASAQDTQGNSWLGQKLDDEAGISAYYKSPFSINLEQVKPAFRTIELETTEYLIGSVAVPNYEEHYDVHVYVNANGWILAYYMKDAPVSKIIDIRAFTIETTKLESVLSIVAGLAGAPFDAANYYDFRYPNATHMLFVAEDGDGGNDFKIQMPVEFGYLERGFAVRTHYSSDGDGDFYIDGQKIQNDYWSNYRGYGDISASQLLPGVEHSISVFRDGILLIIYRMP